MCAPTNGFVVVTQLAQPVRLLLKYTGTEFEDVTYEEFEGIYIHT